MPYTARQLQCLSAMGLVAWRRRDAKAAPGRASTPHGIGNRPFEDMSAPSGRLSAMAGAPAPADAAPVAAPTLATPIPREPATLATWLPEQPLAPFVSQDETLTNLGRVDAPVLVVVEGEPLGGPAANLFERMLASIGRSGRDTCQCSLASVPAPHGESLATLAGTSRAVTLVLVRELDDALDGAGCRLPGDPFGGGAWCLPHPEWLLAEPARKRQAWQVLKTVRAHLPLLP